MHLNKTWLVVFVVAVTVFPAQASTTEPSSSAAERFRSILADLHESRENNHWRSYRDDAMQLKGLLNGSPPSLLEVVRADVHAGDIDAAIRGLGKIARMGQSFDLLAISKAFNILAKAPGFAKVQDEMKANRGKVSHSVMVIKLSDPGMVAEDVDYDPATRRFFITSIREKKIITTTIAGTQAVFARSPDGWPMLAVKVDSGRGVVWATEVAMQGFAPEPDWGKSAVLCYSLETGELLRHVKGPPGAALGDMALTANGDVIVSDGAGGRVYRIRTGSNQLERLDDGQFISPQTPAMAPDHKHLFVADYVRGIGMLNLETKQVRWLSMEERFTLNGIDGLYFHEGKLIAVQNGSSPARVVVFTLNQSLTEIESEKVIERSSVMLGSPTHGVIIHGKFYYIAHSGWNAIDEHGNIKPGAEFLPARIMQVGLGSTYRLNP